MCIASPENTHNIHRSIKKVTLFHNPESETHLVRAGSSLVVHIQPAASEKNKVSDYRLGYNGQRKIAPSTTVDTGHSFFFHFHINNKDFFKKFRTVTSVYHI